MFDDEKKEETQEKPTPKADPEAAAPSGMALSRRERRDEKLRKKFFATDDLRYSAPLSYRHLRLIAWIALAISQILFVNNLSGKVGNPLPISNGWLNVIDVISDLTTPLFLLAIFAVILQKSKSYKAAIITNAVLYIALGGAIAFAFQRYLVEFLVALGLSPEEVSVAGGDILGQRVQFNIFADLLPLTLIDFFINYIPKKRFQGKKIVIFRCLIALPILSLVFLHTMKSLTTLGIVHIPFQFYPFFLTKPPIAHLVFICLSIWTKQRHRQYLRVGGTEEGYQEFLKTNRNSLAFSATASILFLAASILDLAIFFVMTLASVVSGTPLELAVNFPLSYGFGQCVGLFIAIPFILLFSYRKTHKNKTIDLLLPVIGIALIALVYIEGFRYVALTLLKEEGTPAA